MSADPSVPPPVPASPAPPAVAEGSGLPRNAAAALAVMIPLLGGLVFLVIEKKDAFVRFYAIQSIVLGALLAVALIIRGLAEWIFKFVPFLGPAIVFVINFVYGIFALIWLAVYVIALVMAFRGKEWAVPYFGTLARRPQAPPVR